MVNMDDGWLIRVVGYFQSSVFNRTEENLRYSHERYIIYLTKVNKIKYSFHIL